jgi:ribosomal protein S18 acetylase RimI-like enzyme
MASAPTSIPDMLVTTYVQMTRREQFCPAFIEAPGITIKTFIAPDVDFYREVYRAVGEQYRWRDRLIMPDAELKAALAKPGTSVHVMYDGDQIAGYVELVKSGNKIEIAYFGVCPAFQGRGLGKHLLSYGIEQAWAEQGVERVWLHTCNLDSPHALDNYLKRGFQVYKVHRYPMPERYL